MNKTLAAIGGVGLGTGIAYVATRGLRRRRRGEWGPRKRFLAGLAGGALSYYGMQRRGIVGRSASAAGVALATRSIYNRPSRELLGASPLLAAFRR